MSKIYSKDFRECVVQNILDGCRWQKQRGDLSTSPRGRYKVRKFSDEALLSFIESHNESTLEEISQHFGVVRNAIWKRLNLLDITRKKNDAIRRA